MSVVVIDLSMYRHIVCQFFACQTEEPSGLQLAHEPQFAQG